MGFTYSNTTDDLYLPQFYDGALALADATPIILDSTRPSVSGVDGTVALIDVWSDPAAHDDGSWLTAQTLGCRTSPRAVAVSGDTMVVGLPWEDRLPAPMSGAAHVYVRDKTGWRLADFIDPPDQTQYGRFGHAVAIDGDTILVSQCDPYPRIAEPGIVYVYVRKGSTWRLQTRLTGDGSTDTRRAFGVSVTISGDTAVVGAPRARIGVKTEAGAVFIFKRSGDSWSQVQRLTAPTVRDDALFGEDTALDHGTLVVGAPMYDTGGDVNAGAAWVYGRSGGVWKIGARLSPGDPHVDDQFGSPLALSGDTVAVSAPKKDDKGAVIVFVRRAGTWRQQAELTTNDRLGD
ncbi:MAG: hypothetical protein FJ000_09025, partial [Actinobacteria bacterium]|nr:hypothetical protein [Actinomycetota bacterium]